MSPRVAIVRAKPESDGARLDARNITCPDAHVVAPTYDAYAEGNLTYRVLLELPVATRRELYLLVTNNADLFNAVPYSKSTKVHAHPSRGRR